MFDSIDFESLRGIGLTQALAVGGEKRRSQLPDVPTLAELGFSGFLRGQLDGPGADDVASLRSKFLEH